MLIAAVISLLLAPLAGALVNGLRWKSENIKPAAFLGIIPVFISFLSAVYLFFSLFYSKILLL